MVVLNPGLSAINDLGCINAHQHTFFLFCFPFFCLPLLTDASSTLWSDIAAFGVTACAAKVYVNLLIGADAASFGLLPFVLGFVSI